MSVNKIVGIVLSKNDWGQLGIAITYALQNHVDHVYVINHYSEDETAAGLSALKEIFKERITVFHYPNLPFDQSTITNSFAYLAKESGFEWIYVFDSDEFLIVDQGHSLRAILGELDVPALIYPVQNYISVTDFEKNNLASYARLIYQSKPSKNAEVQSIEDIYSGKSNFFDYPFPAKCIFRASDLTWIDHGAHKQIWSYSPVHGSHDSRVRCAHLTLPSIDNLTRKARQGEEFQRAGYPFNHGWQAQLIYRIEQEDGLKKFWAHHSINEVNGVLDGPVFEKTHELVEALESTIQLLAKEFESSNLCEFRGKKLKKGVAKNSTSSVGEFVRVFSSFGKHTDQFLTEITRLQKRDDS